MRNNILTLAAALLVAALCVRASVLYVEVPDPYTKQDYLEAVRGANKGAELLELMKADAYAQMEAIGDPMADYVIFATKNGEVIRPDWENKNAEKPAPGETDRVITYARGDGWEEEYWAQANKHIEGAYHKIKKVYGDPLGSGSFTVHVDLDPGAPAAYYHSGLNLIVLKTWDYEYPDEMDAYRLTHEMVHSFHDDWVIPWDQFEEGFAEAVAHEVQNLMHVGEPRFCELWHKSLVSEEYETWYHEFHFNQNMPGIGTRLPSFSSPDAIGRSAMSVFRYKAAGFCWWKVWFSDHNFFINFNTRYYAIPTDVFSQLQTMAIASYSGGTLEGIPFDRWLYEQEILNIPPGHTKAMFLSVLYNKFRLWLYERDEGPEGEEEVPLPFERVDFELGIVGQPAGYGWTAYTCAGGSIVGGIDFPPDFEDHRVRLGAFAPNHDLTRVAFGWGSAFQPGDQEICGATTGIQTGDVELSNLDTGEISIAPVINGAFHLHSFPEPPVGEGDARYALTLYNDSGAPLKTVHFNKDAACYFKVINDLDADAGGSSATAEPETPFAALPFTVSTNKPNPCSTYTSVGVTLPAAAPVEVVVYDLCGRRVASPFAGVLPAGANNIAIDTSRLAPGVYVYRVLAGANTATKKMVVAR